MSRRQRVNKDTSTTKKEIAAVAALSLIPVVGAFVVPTYIIKKVAPKVLEKAGRKKDQFTD
jgi:hypothetical protein